MAITAVSCTLSALATAIISWRVDGSVRPSALVYGLIVPAIIAPPISFMTLRMVRQLHVAQAALERLSRTDPLTQVANRRLFMERAELELARARRYQGAPGLVLMDLDNLKQTNDVRGHLAGDALLVEVAKVSQALCRESDTFARIGGDEFGFVLDQLDDVGLEAFSRRLLTAIRAIEIPYRDHVLTTSVSIGSTRYLATDSDLSQILWRADEAMYAAKRAGGDRYQRG